MSPHPRIRKTVKWSGEAVTVLLVVVWIQSLFGFFGIGRGAWMIGLGHGSVMAAIGGDAGAMLNLSLCYVEGDGVARNRRWSNLWLRRAANAGHARANRLLRKLSR